MNNKKKYTEKELIDHLVFLKEKLGRVPTQKDMKEQPGPSPDVYHIRFLGWNNALKLVGCKSRQGCKPLTDSELLELLREVAFELGRAPFQREVSRIKTLPGHRVYIKRFGSWDKALKLAGISEFERPNYFG